MKYRSFVCVAVVLSLVASSFADESADESASRKLYPFSEASNAGGWTFNPDVSDEFEASDLDTSKWFVQGTDGVYRSNFIGRAPSQFSTDNVRLENGKLKLQAKWEPGFDFTKKLDFS